MPAWGKDHVGALLLIALGAAVVVQGSSYEVGTLSRMGPGYLPVALGVMLCGLGVIQGIVAALRQTAPAAGWRPEWRGWACIVLGLLAFRFAAAHLGLLPAAFAVVLISAFGDRTNTLRGAATLAAAISIVAVVVFWWALQIQMPLVAWDWG